MPRHACVLQEVCVRDRTRVGTQAGFLTHTQMAASLAANPSRLPDTHTQMAVNPSRLLDTHTATQAGFLTHTHTQMPVLAAAVAKATRDAEKKNATTRRMRALVVETFTGICNGTMPLYEGDDVGMLADAMGTVMTATLPEEELDALTIQNIENCELHMQFLRDMEATKEMIKEFNAIRAKETMGSNDNDRVRAMSSEMVIIRSRMDAYRDRFPDSSV